MRPKQFKAAPILKVADAGGRFDGSPFPASATIAGVVAGVDSTPASSLDNVTNFFAADAPDFSTPHIVCGPGRSRAPAC